MGEGVCTFPHLLIPSQASHCHIHPLAHTVCHSKWIISTLERGTTIICDRYYYSGMVYSAAKHNSSLPVFWARHPEVNLPRPDLVIFLDLSPSEAEKRGGFGEEKYEKKQFQQEVRKQFLDLRFCGGDEEQDMKVVDAGATIEQVQQRIWTEVQDVVEAVGRGERGESGVVTAWDGAEAVLKEFGSFEAARKANA